MTPWLGHGTRKRSLLRTAIKRNILSGSGRKPPNTQPSCAAPPANRARFGPKLPGPVPVPSLVYTTRPSPFPAPRFPAGKRQHRGLAHPARAPASSRGPRRHPEKQREAGPAAGRLRRGARPVTRHPAGTREAAEAHTAPRPPTRKAARESRGRRGAPIPAPALAHPPAAAPQPRRRGPRLSSFPPRTAGNRQPGSARPAADCSSQRAPRRSPELHFPACPAPITGTTFPSVPRAVRRNYVSQRALRRARAVAVAAVAEVRAGRREVTGPRPPERPGGGGRAVPAARRGAPLLSAPTLPPAPWRRRRWARRACTSTS